MTQELTNLEQLLERIGEVAQHRDTVSLGAIVSVVGARSFGPLLLLVGILMISPLSGIPGMPSSMSLFALLIAVQMLLNRRHFWLPRCLRNRSLSRTRLEKIIRQLRPVARRVDRLLRPRLTFLIHRAGADVIALLCVFIALFMPLMEVIPFSATSAGVIFTIFGLALIARDGFLALIALSFTTTGLVWLVARVL